MELKNALAVCLITLFSATIVVLIARALDSQAASQLQPQLEQIAAELHAIRKGGGIAAISGGEAADTNMTDGLQVYYFHSNARCPTCRSIESQSHDAVHEEFASQLHSGKVAWKILNYEKSSGAALAKRFEVQMPVVVLARMQDGQIADWKRLERVWALVGDKPAFREYVRSEIAKMLKNDQYPEPSASPAAESPMLPDISSVDDESAEVPLPTDAEISPAANNIPLPQ